jgi:hypothetical protein
MQSLLSGGRPISECVQVLINASDLSEARSQEGVKWGEVLRARSIDPFEGGRWRLRQTRANGWTRSNGSGN